VEGVFIIMPRSRLDRNDMVHKLLGMKTALFEDSDSRFDTDEKKEAAHQVLNTLLDYLNEFTY